MNECKLAGLPAHFRRGGSKSGDVTAWLQSTTSPPNIHGCLHIYHLLLDKNHTNQAHEPMSKGDRFMECY